MENFKYLVISELVKLGFIHGTYDSLEQAKLVVDVIFNSSNQLSYNETQVILKSKSIESYEIKGHEIHNVESEYGHFNGFYSVCVVQIKSGTNSIKIFIKERENYSWVFEYEKYEDEFERLGELFSSFDIGAN